MSRADRPAGTRAPAFVLVPLLLAGLVVVFLSPVLWWGVLAGVLIALSMRNPTRSRRIATALFLIVVPIVLLLPATEDRWIFRHVTESWSVTRNAEAHYEEDRGVWRVMERIAFPEESLEAVAYHVRPFEKTLAADEQTLEADTQAEMVADALVQDGWTREPNVDGELSMSKEREIPAEVPAYPVTTSLELPLPSLALPDGMLLLHSGDGSTITINTPDNLILDTRPAAEPVPVPDGEQFKIPLWQDGAQVESVELTAVSPLVRPEPLRSLTHFSESAVWAWVVAAASGLMAAIAQDHVKGWLGRKIPFLEPPGPAKRTPTPGRPQRTARRRVPGVATVGRAQGRLSRRTR